jgi:BR serine/threonine kinase
MEEAPTQLGSYVLLRFLGQGTTGKVRLAFDQKNNRNVAIKIVKKSLFEDRPGLQTKIQREIALMGLVDHPHLLKLVDILESPRHLYIVTEYAGKGELFDYLVQHHFLPENVAMNFFRQIIYGLEYLHSLGICHRDLKPENILLDDNLNIKIADFGFARVVKENIAETSCGSPHYAAPEVIRGQPYDGRAADVWSCGVILFALLAGYLPFDDPNIRTLLGKVKRGIYTMPQFPDRVKDLIRGMLTLDPTKRFTIAQIKAHECFRGDIMQEYVFPTPLPISSFNEPIPEDQLTDEVFDTLLKIGYPSKESLKEELTKSQPSISKVFFHMITSRLAIEQIDWSASVSSLTTTYGAEDSYLIDVPTRQAFAVMGSDPFHRHAYGPKSHSDEPMSLAKKVDWALPEKEDAEVEQTHTLDCSSIPLTYVMLSVQRAVRQLGMQWFHPDDFSIICRHVEMGIYVSTNVFIENSTLQLSLQLLNGTPQAFTAFCQAVETSFSEVREFVIDMEEDDDDDDNEEEGM